MLLVAVLGIASQGNAKGSLARICQRAAPSLDCEGMTADQLRKFRRFVGDPELSLTCGTGICDGKKTFFNCPYDCREDGSSRGGYEATREGSYNGRTHCPDIKAIRRPNNAEEAQAAIEEALANDWTVRPLGASHTDNEVICSDGMVVTNENFNRPLRIGQVGGKDVVFVEPGITLGELGAWLKDRNYTLGHGIVGYHLVTVAGVIGTGAHGSALRATSVLSDQVEYLKILVVNQDRQVETVELSAEMAGVAGSDLWKAARVSLGALGYIVEVGLRIEPNFHIKVQTKSYSGKKYRRVFEGDSIWSLAKDCDVVAANFFPERTFASPRLLVHCGQAIMKPSYQTWQEFNAEVDPGAVFALHSPKVSNFFYTHLVGDYLHKVILTPRRAELAEAVRSYQLTRSPPWVKQSRTGRRVFAPSGIRGHAHDMQNSGGTADAHYFRQADWEVAIPFSEWANAFRLVNDRLKKAGDPLYVPLTGVYVRFSRVSDTLLAHGAAGGKFKAGEPVMFMEIPEFIPTFDVQEDDPETKEFAQAILDEYERPYREFIQVLVEQASGRVHWAKNRMEFIAEVGLQSDRKPLLERFAVQSCRMDPHGVFANRMTNLGGVTVPCKKEEVQPEPKTSSKKSRQRRTVL